jgi:hypothetical protein
MAGSSSALPAPPSRLVSFLAPIGRRIEGLVALFPQSDQFIARRNKAAKEAEDEINKWLERQGDELLTADNFSLDTKFSLTRHRKERARYEFWQSVIWGWFRVCAWIVGAGCLLAAVILSQNLYPKIALGSSPWLLGLCAGIIAVVIFLVAFVPLALLNDLLEYLIPKRVDMLWLITLALILITWLYGLERGWFATASGWDFLVTFSGVTACLLGLVCLSLLRLATAAVDSWLDRSFSRNAPSASIALDLFFVLQYRPWDIIWTNFLDTRRLWASKLERAAASMEFDLPRRLACGDPGLDLATAQAMAGRAAAIRNLAKRILLSSPDKAAEIRSELRDLLAKVCRMDWESLPVKTASVLTKRERATAWLRSAARSLLLAAVPAAILIAIHRFQIGLSPEQLSWTSLVLLVLLGLALYGLIDPDYGATSKMLDTLGRFNLPFLKKKKDGGED